jgi:hypothetical protein
METRPSPSVLRIVQQDYASLLCVLGPVVFWGLFVAVDVLGLGRRPDAKPFFRYAAPAVTAVALPLLVVRVRRFARLFRDGVEVSGRVTACAFERDRGRVEFTFEHDGKSYAGGAALHRTARTAALAPGQELVVLFDPAAPESALLRDLYV